jgi:hypothetical protein
MRHVKPLITLALACLLAVPAMAQNGNAGPGGIFNQFGLSEEQKATMTLGELKDLVKDQNNQPGLNGANGANMNRAMGPQGNMAGMAGADGRNMMGAQGPQGCIFGMGGASGNMMGAQGPQGNMPMMAGANCNMMGSQCPQGNMPGGSGAGPQQQNMGFMNAPNSDGQGPRQ